MGTKNKNYTRNAHHLWSAHSDEGGKVKLVRSKMEPENFEDLEGTEKEAAREVSNAYWGLWGASLTDNELLSSDIPAGIVDRLNIVAGEMSRKQASARVYNWNELRTAFGSTTVDEIRKSISDGMKIRMISKHLDVPFIITAELIDHFGDTDKQELKDIVDLIRNGNSKRAVKEFGSKAQKVKKICDHYVRTGSTKLAVDEKAKSYWENFYGPYGKELTREIKRRVRADLLGSWMHKNGVDDSAKDYWSSYYSEGYGEEMVKDLAKKLSPVKG